MISLNFWLRGQSQTLLLSGGQPETRGACFTNRAHNATVRWLPLSQRDQVLPDEFCAAAATPHRDHGGIYSELDLRAVSPGWFGALPPNSPGVTRFRRNELSSPGYTRPGTVSVHPATTSEFRPALLPTELP